MEDRYETGKGLFGGPGGTYGRYSVGSRVTAQGKSLRNILKTITIKMTVK